MIESAFSEIFGEAKSEIWYEEPPPSVGRVVELFGEAIRNIETLDHLKQVQITLGFSRLNYARRAILDEYGAKLDELGEKFATQPATSAAR